MNQVSITGQDEPLVIWELSTSSTVKCGCSNTAEGKHSIIITMILHYIFSIFRSSWGSERTWWIFQEKSRYIGTFSGKFIDILLVYDLRLVKSSLWKKKWWVMNAKWAICSVISWQEQVNFDKIWWCLFCTRSTGLVGFYC
jgi:hypothetical protein